MYTIIDNSQVCPICGCSANLGFSNDKEASCQYLDSDHVAVVCWEGQAKELVPPTPGQVVFIPGPYTDQGLETIVSSPFVLQVGQPGRHPTSKDLFLSLPPLTARSGDDYIVANHVYDEDDNLVGYEGAWATQPGDWLSWRIQKGQVCVYANVARITLYLSPIHDSHGRFMPVLVEARGEL